MTDDDYSQKALLLAEKWPKRLKLITIRAWDDIPVNEKHMTVFLTFLMDPDHMVSRSHVDTCLALLNESQIQTWISFVCSKLMTNTLLKSEVKDSLLSTFLETRVQLAINGLSTFPPLESNSLNLGVLLDNLGTVVE